MTPKHWALFGIVQALGLALVFTSNIHTNGLPFIIGFLLLAPGVFISSKLDLGGSSQSAIIAVLINAVVWHFVIKLTWKKGET